MKNNSEIRVCKNKKCKKTLPVGYKHSYCEACRNKTAQTLKEVGAKFGLIAGVATTAIVTLGKKPKN